MELDFYLVAILANEEEARNQHERLEPIKTTNAGDLKFFLKVLNLDDVPYKNTKDIENKLVIGYESHIPEKVLNEIIKGKKSYEIPDAFREYAKDKLFIFKPYLNYNEDYLEMNVNIANYTLKIVDKPKSFVSRSDTSLMTIPIFSDYNEFEFEKRLLNNESIGNFESMEKLPSGIISGDYLYGEIESSEKLNDGFRVTTKDEFKKLSIDLEEYSRYYIKFNNLLFIDFSIFTDKFIEALYEHGEIVNSSKNIKLKHKDINELENNERYSETQFLEQFENIIKSEGYIYSSKQLVNLHTSLKTGRLVILNGPSGTGKTNLIYQYAKALGLTRSKLDNFKIVPVKPNWKDDTELLGFLDTINNIYRPSETGLLDTLIEASKQPDQLYIICFDEMNLAKIEYYFAQFLSLLEIDPKNRKLYLYNKSLIGRVFNYEYYPHEIKIGENVLFVGTINNDETTETISDKVLDRCNFIDLDLPKNHVDEWLEFKGDDNLSIDFEEENNNTNIKTVSYENFGEWKSINHKVDLLNEEIKVIKELSGLLKNIGTDISFRTLNHINIYMKNLPNNNKLTREEAFDLQIAQKILPKVRGSQVELNEILFGEDNLENILTKDKYPKSNELLKQKARELKIYGFTY
ncbi:McrB family protein [Staphylococcus hominis]|uniref:McrB family protein n=1 Tax=Staphylococcus hominis TaxID=1290 RepID=UPI001E3E7E16|nr:PhoH family protein [Staphylococcus hominis]MCD8763742.1 PhoH family protein [Staphylococcus hominis]